MIALILSYEKRHNYIDTSYTYDVGLTMKFVSEFIKRVIGGKPTPKHKATRCFQALRIEVNHELSSVERLLMDGPRCLKPGGRMAVISFHSLEDRIVKEAFRKLESPCTCPRDFPVCVCGKRSLGEVITKKPVTACEEEIANNSRAHCCKLRVFERNNVLER